MREATSISAGKRVNWYDLSLMDERDENSQHVVPVQSTGSVEGQLPETEGASAAYSVRLECDSGGGQARKNFCGKRKW